MTPFHNCQADVVTNAPTEGRLVVILLDRNIAYGRSAQTVREVGAAIVDQLGPGDRAAVVHTAHLNPSQNFTADRQRLLADAASYYPSGSPPAATNVRSAASDRFSPDITGLFPNAALPLRMALMPVAAPGHEDSAVGMVLNVDRGTRSSDGGRTALGEKAFDTNGREQGSVRQVFDAAAIPGSFDVLARMHLRPGQYEIRAILDAPGRASTAGSVYGYIDVPDSRRQRISLSGVALGRRGRAALPSDGLADVLPTVPTAERAFAPSDRVRWFVRMYQQTRGRPVAATLTVAVLDATDRVLTEQTTGEEQSLETMACVLRKRSVKPLYLTVRPGCQG